MTDRVRPWFMLIPPIVTLLACCRAAAQEPELLFRVTFDDLTTNAQVAKGSPKSTLTLLCRFLAAGRREHASIARQQVVVHRYTR
jgi:hypothetical protein